MLLVGVAGQLWMWMILQADEAEDWVMATGVTTEVREFVRMAFMEWGVEVEFSGEGVDEKAVVRCCNNAEYKVELGKEVVAVDPRYFRPTEVDLLIGDASKAREKLGWSPKYDLKALVADMVEGDLSAAMMDKRLVGMGCVIRQQSE